MKINTRLSALAVIAETVANDSTSAVETRKGATDSAPAAFTPQEGATDTSMGKSFDYEIKDGKTICRLKGKLDAVSAPEARTLIDKLIKEKCTDVTLDVSGLTEIDSSGVGVIVSLVQHVKKISGKVKIIGLDKVTSIGLNKFPRRVFGLLRLDRVFPT